jgi:sulfite exporter TauE/SafE
MTLDGGSISLAAALVAGLAGSGHCLGMCGGIAGALAMRGQATLQPGADGAAALAPGPAPFSSRLTLALAYNLSRVTSYAIAGGLAGLLGHTLLRAVDVAPLSVALRVLAGLIMVAAAGRLLFGWRLLDPLEAAGSGLWRRVMPQAGRGARRGGVGGAVGLGLAWGWLPCGLTYSMLLLAATTASVSTGALVMVAFGLGTMPAMVTATVAFDRAARALRSRASLRNVAGVLLLAFGAWTAGNAVYHAYAHGSHAAHATHDMSQVPAGHEGHDMSQMPAGHEGHDMSQMPAGHEGHDMSAGDMTATEPEPAADSAPR